jgi:hypothetical protein
MAEEINVDTETVKMSFKSGNEESSANRYDTTFSSQEIVVT